MNDSTYFFGIDECCAPVKILSRPIAISTVRLSFLPTFGFMHSSQGRNRASFLCYFLFWRSCREVAGRCVGCVPRCVDDIECFNFRSGPQWLIDQGRPEVRGEVVDPFTLLRWDRVVLGDG